MKTFLFLVAMFNLAMHSLSASGKIGLTSLISVLVSIGVVMFNVFPERQPCRCNVKKDDNPIKDRLHHF
jgi:hypothetical protein